MATECELLANCGFFRKYSKARNLACEGFIRMYCRGAKMDECKRKQYRREHGAPPPDDMMPNGCTISQDESCQVA